MSRLPQRCSFGLVLGLAMSLGGMGCTPGTATGGVVKLKDMDGSGDGGNTDTDGGGSMGDGGIVLVDDMGNPGRHWTDVSFPIVPDGGNLWNAFNDGTGTVVVAGDYGRVLKSTKHSAFVEDTSLKPAAPALLTVSGVGPLAAGQPLYVAGLGGAMWKYSSGNFADATGAWAPDSPQTGSNLYSVWVAPDGTAFAVGDAVAIKRTTAGWALIAGPVATEAAYALWGTTVGTGYSIYAVGAAGKIWHSTGGDFTQQTSGTPNALYGVWGASATDVYAVGDVGTILHSTGNGVWTTQNAGVNLTALEGISGASASEIYVVGDPDKSGKSVLLHKLVATSDIWFRETPANIADTRHYFGVTATATDIYVVGDTGTILHK
ncbi:MAG: hypothetical protein ABI321_03120 [Polyangia bacterium]